MEQALLPVQILFYIMGGLGLFFTGVGVLWFVTVFKEKKEQYRKLAAGIRTSQKTGWLIAVRFLFPILSLKLTPCITRSGYDTNTILRVFYSG